MRHMVLIAAVAVFASAFTTVLVGGVVLSADSVKSADKSTPAEESAPLGVGGGLAQGDVDCSSAVDAVDALKVLRHNAGLSVSQTEPCTNIGLLLEVTGYERVMATDSQSVAGALAMSVTCPVGKRVFGGGVRRTSGTLSGLSWAVLESYPQANGTTWSVLIHQTDASTRNYEVSAICAPASP